MMETLQLNLTWHYFCGMECWACAFGTSTSSNLLDASRHDEYFYQNFFFPIERNIHRQFWVKTHVCVSVSYMKFWGRYVSGSLATVGWEGSNDSFLNRKWLTKTKTNKQAQLECSPLTVSVTSRLTLFLRWPLPIRFYPLGPASLLSKTQGVVVVDQHLTQPNGLSRKKL